MFMIPGSDAENVWVRSGECIDVVCPLYSYLNFTFYGHMSVLPPISCPALSWSELAGINWQNISIARKQKIEVLTVWNAFCSKANIGLSLYPDNISPCQGEWKCFKNSELESAVLVLGVTRRQELWILNRRLSQVLGVKVKIWSEMWDVRETLQTANTE